MTPQTLCRFQLVAVVLVSTPLLTTGCSGTTDAAPRPVVESVSPASGPLAGGTSLIITGRNFSGITSVTVGGNEVTNRQVVSSTQITGTVPAAIAVGVADVVVAAGSESNRCTACFTYLGLSVDAVSHTALSTAGSVTVTITGTNFTNITSVTIGGTEITNRSVVSSTEITGTAPALAVGSKNVVVTSSAYGSGTCAGCIMYLPDALLASTISAGFYHSCQIVAGAASCWGLRQGGALGTPVNEDAHAPIAVSGGLSFKSIGAGSHSCGLTTTGVVYCWGSNDFGQLGRPGDSSAVPVVGAGGLTFAALSVGGAHTCGLTTAGVAYCWGHQLANGASGNTTVPAAVGGSLRFSLLSAGGRSTCGLTPAGKAYCWGDNTSAQFGNGTTQSSATPVAVSGDLSFADIAVGVEHACGLTPAGVAYCWGANSGRQLGIGDVSGGSLVPVPVSGGLTFTRLSTGYYHTCGIVTSGALYCWGGNQEGPLGIGPGIGAVGVPTAVLGGLTFTEVTAGDLFTCGATAGGNYCWGTDRHGQVGNGKEQTFMPVAVSGLGSAGLVRGAIYGNYNCALTSGGAASCWGENNGGPLGNGAFSGERALPVAVSGGLSFITIAPAGNHNCAVAASGAAYCWGMGIFGELGLGPTLFADAPTPVVGGLSFNGIASGIHHTCGLTTAGAAYCWGENDLGQLGNGSGTDSNQPVPVSGGHTFSAIVSGNWHTCGLEGTNVYCWGEIYGNYLTPQWINPSQPYVAIFAGGWHSCALTSAGAAHCWGSDQFGQLGNGGGGLAFATLALGNEHTCGITTAGATYCWGHNTSGQLGKATPVQSSTPIAIEGDQGFTAITAGQFHTCAMTSAGVTYCWGDNYYGQLGRGTFGYASVPVAVAPVFATAATVLPRR